MKKMLSVVLILAMVLALIPAGVVTVSADESDFVHDGGMITDYIGAGGNVVIPDTLGGYPVTSIYGECLLTAGIYEGAFMSCHNITSVTIPESVTSIGEGAFWYCSSLKTVNFNAENCTYMGYSRFFGGDEYYLAFQYCPIETLNIGSNVRTIPDYAFNNTGIKEITIPESVTKIGIQAFTGFSALNLVNFNALNCVTGGAELNAAFSLRSKITVNFGGNVQSVPANIFFACSLATVTIPESVTGIGDDAFYACSIDLLNFNAADCETVDFHAFEQCSIKSVVFGANVRRIPEYTFASCAELTSVNIPTGVKSIGEAAFYYCSSLKEIILPDSITSIEGSAFEGCAGLTEIVLPSNLTGLGAGAFMSCNNITSVTIPESVTSIGEGVFSDCSSLTDILIPISVTTIGETAFYNCTSLKKIVLPSSVTDIRDVAFLCCTELTSIVIPASVTSIGEYSFDACDQLTIYCFESSLAHNYAKSKSIKYKLINIIADAAGPGCSIDYQNMFIKDLPAGITTLDGYLDLAAGCTLSFTPNANGFGTGSIVNIIKDSITVESFKIVIPGDICGNGKITALDALMALQASSGKITLTAIQQLAADADNNDTVSAVDALKILQLSTGKITEF